MNMHTPTPPARGSKKQKAQGDHCSLAEAAALDWEVWTEDCEGTCLPSIDECATMMTSVRIAWKLMFLTKDEMLAAIAGMPDGAQREVFDALEGASDLLNGLSVTVRGASARFLAGSAAAALKAEAA